MIVFITKLFLQFIIKIHNGVHNGPSPFKFILFEKITPSFYVIGSLKPYNIWIFERARLFSFTHFFTYTLRFVYSLKLMCLLPISTYARFFSSQLQLVLKEQSFRTVASFQVMRGHRVLDWWPMFGDENMLRTPFFLNRSQKTRRS